MKQINVTVSFEEEKLNALRRYMAKKDLEPERELREAMLKLYEKYVPAPVREYIDESDIPVPGSQKPKRPVKPAAPVAPALPPERNSTEVDQHEQP